MDTHLHHDHIETHLKSSDFLRDVVIGMSDGLTVPFALAAGLSGAVDSSNIIVIAGIAEIAAGSIAMGLGGYLAGKTEQDHYVRMEIIHSIGRAGGDTAVEFLRAWIEDEELGSEATHAIASMSSEIPTQISLQLLSIGHAFAPAVAHRLGQRCENRAIPHLVKLMIESNFAMHPFRPYWGSTIAVFGNMEAFKALQPLTADPDVQIRSSALNGMGLLAFSAKSAAIKSSARELLERALQNEVDSELRAAIQLSLDILPKPNG